MTPLFRKHSLAKALLALVSVCLGESPLFSQGEENKLFFSEGSQATESSPAIVTVFAAVQQKTEAIQFAVCHDESQLFAETVSTEGKDILKVNAGKGPDFLQWFIDKDQDGRLKFVEFYMVVGFPTPTEDAIRPGTHSVCSITYQHTRTAKPGQTELIFCPDFSPVGFSDEDGNEYFPVTGKTEITISRDGVPPVDPSFIRGDMNQDSDVNISDMIAILGHLFWGRPQLCEKAGDTNDDDKLDLPDVIFVGDFLFREGAPLFSPVAKCGVDLTSDNLGCDVFSFCDGS
jgi:hypothetical protein